MTDTHLNLSDKLKNPHKDRGRQSTVPCPFNLGYDVGELFGIVSLVESGKNLSVGATVYNDYDGSDWGKRRAMSVVMKIGYVIVGNPVDLLIYMWGK